jgi:iron complex outermembrane recepter protein
MSIQAIPIVGLRQLALRAHLWFRIIVMSTLVNIGISNANAQNTGSISGTVFNTNTRKSLERAEVSIEGTRTYILTDNLGNFRITGLRPGSYVLSARYAGLDDAQQTVVVTAGEVAMIAIALSSDIYELDAYTVSGEREGTAYALQQQQQSASQINVVSADAFGIISDANPGEFLKLLPGIQMDYTGIEPRGMRVRGISPNLNLVLINGNQAAAAAGSSTNRNFEFDQTTLDNIETIEVFKAPLPSMPANSIGGTVNLVTRSAFLQKGRRLDASVNVSMNADNMSLSRTRGPFDKSSRKMQPGGSLTYSNTFMDGRLGVVFSTSAMNLHGAGYNATRSFTYSNTPPAPEPYTKDTPVRLNTYGRNDHMNFTNRSGSSLNLDFKVSDSTAVFLRTTLTDHYYYFANRTWNIAAPASANVVPGWTAQRMEVTSGTFNQNVTVGDKMSKSLTINPGVRHRFDNWTIEYDASVSRATNEYNYLPDNNNKVKGAPNFANVTVTLRDVGYIVESQDKIAAATVTQTSGPSIYDLANYLPTGFAVSTNDRSSVDKVIGAKGRVRRDFMDSLFSYVEAGASFQEQERSRKQPQRRWTYVGPDGIAGTDDDTTQANMQQFAERGNVPDIGFGKPAPNAWVSPFRLADFYLQSPQAFVQDYAYAYERAFINDRTIQEMILSGYVMTLMKFGKLDVLAGLRMEQTEVKGEGAKKDDSKVPTGVAVNSLQGMIAKYSRTNAKNSYTSDPFKYLHLTYDFSDTLQARASYTESIGRPNFGSILPGSTTSESAQTITIQNTGLNPERSNNIDVSVEWYASGTSSFTAAWFRKDIKDYINNSRVFISSANPDLDIGSEYIGWEMITSDNLGKAEIEGYEIGGRYQFAFLPEVLSNLEVFGNYTNLYKTEGTFSAGQASTLYKQLPDTAPESWNLGFSYWTPNRKLYIQLRANYNGAKPTNILGRPFAQTDSRLTYDGEIRYILSPTYTLSLSGRNITSEWEGGSQLGRVVRTGNGGGTAITLTLLGRF